jgi:branched-subunit amino acid aminotransferase/4-amino-4-deoxychorismate lyase
MELDGQPVTAAEVMPLALTNFGHFTSMRVEADATVRGFGLHMERLVSDCKWTFGATLDPDRVRVYVRQVIDRATGPLALRVTVYDPDLTMGVIGNSAHPRVLVTATAAGAMPTTALRAKSYPFTRDGAEIKHTGLWSQMRRRREARLAGYDDALFVEPDHSVSEGATWTVGFIDADDRLIWPEAPTLPSTTVHLLRQLRESSTAVVKLDDLPHMRAAFATNVSVGVRPISQIDAVDFPSEHPALTALHEAYVAIPGEVV